MPHVKEILGRNLIKNAPPDDDMHRNTDLLVLEPVRIACRVRQNMYVTERDYRNEFTLRQTRLQSGAKSELLKIMRGDANANYVLYGFAAETGDRLCAYVLGDLREFREWYFRYMVEHGGQQPGVVVENGDGGSNFRAFKIADLPKSFVVERVEA